MIGLHWWGDIFFAMLVLHALCDFPLQGDYMAQAKNPRRAQAVPWTIVMSAHGLIHAGAVWLVTGSDVLGLMEFAAHVATDILKCYDKLTFAEDQAVHVACKAAWTALWLWFVAT